MPPGYSSIASTKSLLESKFAFRMMEMTAENLIELGMVVAGSAATVRERLAAYARELGVGNLIAMLQIATLPADLTENLRLFAKDGCRICASRVRARRPARSPRQRCHEQESLWLSSSAQADDLVIAEIDDWHGGASRYR